MNNCSKNGYKALVLGGTGAMGLYLVPELAEQGYEVCVVSLDDAPFTHPHISCIKANVKNSGCLEELLKNKYDVIIDFMIYSTEEFLNYYILLLSNTDHYIYLSSYRVYSGDVPVKESTPRLLDVSQDKEFLATEDYSLYKARQEDILQNSNYNNWTIVRPAITYSKFRYQLVTLEASTVIARTLKGLPVVLPEAALAVQGTMSWAGDVAKMFSGLIFKKAAYRECFTLSTAEHHSWGEIAEYYKEIIGLKYVLADTEDYWKLFGKSPGAYYQLAYDRFFERIIDNSKVLQVTGLKQGDFMPLRRGLELELNALPKDTVWPEASDLWEQMDNYCRNHKG